MGGAAPRTVFRKLAELDQRTSYSHRGAYYTLNTLAHFDGHGLWSHREVRFPATGRCWTRRWCWWSARRRDILPTSWRNSCKSRSRTPCVSWWPRDGCDVSPVRTATFTAPRIVRAGRNNGRPGRPRPTNCWRSSRCSMACSTNNNAGCTPDWRAWSGVMAGTSAWPSCWHWTWRRSHGAAGNCSPVRCSGVGSGGSAVDANPWKKTAKLLNALRQLLATDTAGDPMGRRGVWTGLRLRQISRLLRRLGLRVCPNTVRRLLGRLGYALHANRKSLGAPCAERDRQFHYRPAPHPRDSHHHRPHGLLFHRRAELHDSPQSKSELVFARGLNGLTRNPVHGAGIIRWTRNP